MMDSVAISIAEDFSPFPGGRFREDGPFNGTTFREEFLVKPLRDGKHVVVSFDGVAGFGSSFLEEAFGGLVRDCHFSKEVLAKKLEIVCEEDEMTDFVKVAKEFISLATPS